MLNTVKKEAVSVKSQFELTSEIITKLNTFKITPTAKLVLLYLTTCYNPKHSEVFPKQRTIADKLGISERSVTRAIQELFKEGLILIECKYTNRYKFTSRMTYEQPVNLSDDLRQKDTSKNDNLSGTYIEQKNKTKKEQPFNKGGNVYSGDDAILREYAIKHGAKNINAYIAKLKQTGSAAKIIKEYQRKNQPLGLAYNYAASQKWIEQQKREAELPKCTAASCGFSFDDLVRKGIIKVGG